MFIVTVGKIGFGKTHKQIKNIAEKVATEKEILRRDKITDGWFASFMCCHPDLSLQKGDCTSHARMSAMEDRQAIEQYFVVLKECMGKYDLMDKPSQIYNLECYWTTGHHMLLSKKGKEKFFTVHLVIKIK